MRCPRVVAVVLAVVVGVGAVACSSGGGSASKSAALVTIKNFSFTPPSATLKVGQPVRVQNTDDTTHTFTADDHSFDSGPIVGGASASVMPKHAGDVHYHCSIHTYMTGTLRISG